MFWLACIFMVPFYDKPNTFLFRFIIDEILDNFLRYLLTLVTIKL